MESKKIGHGGDVLLSQITGLDMETIRRGRRELYEMEIEVELAEGAGPALVHGAGD